MKTIVIRRHEIDNKAHIEYPEVQKISIKDAADYITAHGYHFTEQLMKYAISKMVNVDNNTNRITKGEVEQYLINNAIQQPVRSNIYDITYTANMAYADFYPKLLSNKGLCIEYALSVANDVDGYEGIEFCRWVADLMGKNIKLNWEIYMP